MEIKFCYIFKTSNKPVYNGSKIETEENGLKKYEEMLEKRLNKIVHTREIFK